MESNGKSWDPIHIIEPTLETEAGHCHSFVESLCRAAGARPPSMCIWAGSRARLPRLESSGITVRPYFHRRIRRIQEYFLLRKLLGGPGRIFLSTGGRIDLILLDRASGREIPPEKAYLYVHWVRPTAAKEDSFRKVAQKQPHIVILAPTPSIGEIFSRCGFEHTKIVPYPITPKEEVPDVASAGFRHLLFAGAARQDKGFSAMVDLVAFLANTGSDIPIVMQASPDHYDRFDPDTKAALLRLHSVRYPSLRVVRKTLKPGAYSDLFRGGICLQPYRREDFADRISGVTLDALSAGCPVVVTDGTWMSRVIRRFDAGREVGDLSPESLMAAVHEIRSDYGEYRKNAARAGKTLQEENSGRHLLSILSGDG